MRGFLPTFPRASPSWGGTPDAGGVRNKVLRETYGDSYPTHNDEVHKHDEHTCDARGCYNPGSRIQMRNETGRSFIPDWCRGM